MVKRLCDVCHIEEASYEFLLDADTQFERSLYGCDNCISAFNHLLELQTLEEQHHTILKYE